MTTTVQLPLQFPAPAVWPGHRIGPVACYNPSTRRCSLLDGVLMRKDDDGRQPQRAYYKIPFKEPVPTTLGHVEFCHVLVRRHLTASIVTSSDADTATTTPVFEWTNQSVAVKVTCLDRVEPYSAEDPYQEIAALQLLGTSPAHVVGAIDALSDGHHVFLVMRYCHSGDFFQLLQGCALQQQHRIRSPTQSWRRGLREDEARYWFLQLIQGVQYLHSKGICHRDLSPENIMIDWDEVLIIDLGMCLRVEECNDEDISHRPLPCRIQPLAPVGKLPYMSPEVYESCEPFDGYAADVWMCGTILFCMLTGNRSYRYPNRSDSQFYWMTERLRELLVTWEVQLSDDAVTLLESMLKVDASKRLTLTEIQHHPWFTANPTSP